MNKLIIALVCLAFGVLFVFFPRGTQNITIYNDCGGDGLCALWYSQQVDVKLNGIPFSTDISSMSNSNTIPVSGYIRSNQLKIIANFIIGVAVGFGVVTLFTKLRKPKKP